MTSLVQQAMNAQIAAAAAPLDDSRDWESDAGDGADANDAGEGPVNEKPKPANRRDLMLMSTEDLKKRTEKLEAANEKKFGASKTTLDMLRMMSADALDFITRCAEWEAGKTGIRTQKKEFQKALEDDPFHRSSVMESAWRNRPYGCNSLKKAVLINLKTTLEALKAAQTQGDSLGASMRSAEAQELKNAVDIINERMWTGSKAERVVKDAFGFCQQQEASEQVRADRRRRREEISTEELHRRWPCLAPGWSISAERDAKRNGEAPICRPFQPKPAVAVGVAEEEMPHNEGPLRKRGSNARADFITDTFGEAAAASFHDRRYNPSPPRAPLRANALPEEVQAYANGKRPAPHWEPVPTAVVEGGHPLHPYKKRKPSAGEPDDEDNEDDFL